MATGLVLLSAASIGGMEGTPRNGLAQLILDVRYRGVDLAEPEITEDLEYSAQTATALIRASQKHNAKVPINLAGTIHGHLTANGSVGGDLTISGSVSGGFTISGSVGGDLTIGGSGSVGGDFTIRGSGSVGGDLNIWDSGSVRADLNTWGSVGGCLNIWDSGSVDGCLNIWDSGSVGETLYVSDLGLVSGNFNIRGSVGGDVYMRGSVGGDLTIWDSGTVSGCLNMRGSGSVGGDLSIRGSGTVGENLTILGSVDGRVDLLNVSSLKVGSLSGASFGRPVHLGDGVDLSDCDFRGFSGFEQLRFVGSNLFRSGPLKRISHTHNGQRIGDVELAVIYRQLREVYERQSNRPEASDFYYQEMDARRRSRRSIPEWIVLTLYWLISGFGQRVSRGIVTFFVVAATAASLFLIHGFSPATSGTGLVQFVDALEFSVRSMVSFFSPPDGKLNRLERWGQLFLRFIGPAILAQTVLAVRERVAR